MKNKLTDLNDHLFAQLERLSDEDLSGEELVQEIKRSQAVANVAREIIQNGSLVLKAQKMHSDGLLLGTPPAMLSVEHKPTNGNEHA